jgi:ATP-dependent Clp protease ATP-binding subunit ClpA
MAAIPRQRDDEPMALPINALTPRARRCLIQAGVTAEKHAQLFVGTEHLLLALANDPDGVAGQVLERLGVRSAVKDELAAFIESEGPTSQPHDHGDEVQVGFRPDENGNPRIVLAR